jgi:hypothetical protein
MTSLTLSIGTTSTHKELKQKVPRTMIRKCTSQAKYEPDNAHLMSNTGMKNHLEVFHLQ